MFEAIRVFECGHKVDTGTPMKLFRARKGEMKECQQGCGQQKTVRVEAGKEMDMSSLKPWSVK